MLRGNDGFTLAELMIVVLIIGVLVAVAIPLLDVAKASAQLKTCYANQRTVEGALQTYAATNGGAFPNGGTAGLLLASSALITQRYLKSAPYCPGNAGTYWVSAGQVVTGDQGAAGSWYAGSASHKNFATP